MEKTKHRRSGKHYDVIRAEQLDKPKAVKAEPATPTPPAAPVGRRHGFKQLFASVVFGRLYAVLAVTVLAVTTVIWSILGARLHMANADQLADPFLFRSSAVFHGAQFPGSHSFFLKWPLFWLVKLAGLSEAAFVIVTVLMVLTTVAIFVRILYRIESRPAVFGTIILALASVLLLVPPAPYAGALLPVNMAMLATRNLEYAVYMLSLVLLIRSPRLRSWRFWVATSGLVVLMASDKLFLVLSIGAAAGGLLVYSLRRVQRVTDVMSHWLLAGLLAAVGAMALLTVVDFSGITSIVQSSGPSPYAFVSSGHSMILAIIFGVLGFLTNFGANPAYDAQQLRHLPHLFLDRVATLGGFGYIVNMLILVVLLLMTVSVVIRSLRKGKKRPVIDAATIFALGLLFSTVVAASVFVLTDHYYVVDSRYLTIGLFALFVAGAEYSRRRKWRRSDVVIAGCVILAAICVSVPTSINTYSTDKLALQAVTDRNTEVKAVLAQRHVASLVGDYWRVLPIQQATGSKLRILPLANCTAPRDTLLSNGDRPELHHHAFAYLLSLDKGLTDFPTCSLDQIEAVFGHPDATILTAGSIVHPQEELLFYDHGAHRPTQNNNQSQDTITNLQPITPDKLTSATCDGPSVMNIVAHQDDDLLFTSPDLLADVQAGHCVRTIYVTAGDAGSNQYYWLGRQRGSEAAYSTMLGRGSSWGQRTIKFGDRQYATVVSPQMNSHVSLIFLDLPDGNLGGNGFSAYHNVSVAKLERGEIRKMVSVDGQSSYDSNQLTMALRTLIETYKPTEIRTLATENLSQNYPDHSDHIAVAQYARSAYEQYLAGLAPGLPPPTIRYYVGYPVHDQPPNVSEPQLARKEVAFLAYARYDGSVCHTIEECSKTPTYEAYLSRQYYQPTD